ncbi:hypothetical protein ACWCQW_47395 [Streptomyces mirabilis]
MTHYMSSDEVAALLGIRSTTNANRAMHEAGALNQTVSPYAQATWLRDDVLKVVMTRYTEALRRHPEGLVTYAREVRRQLRPDPPATVTLTDGRRVLRDPRAALTNSFEQSKISPQQRVVNVGTDAVRLFGQAALTAAASPKVDGCRHCLAVALTPVGVDLPGPEPEFRELLGPPCEKDRARYEAARARVASAAAARTARTAPVRRSAGRSAGGGPNTPVYWRSQAQNALKLADQARDRGDHAESRRLRDRAAEYARKAGS